MSYGTDIVHLSDGPDWAFADDNKALAEVHFAATAAERLDEQGADDQQKSVFVKKEILRTGEWPVIPTGAGIDPRPLKIVREGSSKQDEGIISMEEVMANWEKRVIASPQIPLSDDEKNDHLNLTRNNTGFIRDLWVEDSEDGSRMWAKMEFTEPEVGEKVLRGTFADVSCGIPWHVRTRGETFGTCLEHVALTNRPFIDGLGPFLAASNGETNAEVTHFSIAPEDTPEPITMTVEELRTLIFDRLANKLNLDHLTVADIDINERVAVLKTEDSNHSWKAPFTVEDGNVTVSSTEAWERVKEEAPAPPEPPAPEPEPTPEGNPPAPVQSRTAPRRSSDDDLEAAYRLREMRLHASAQTVHHPEQRERNMPLTQEELDRMEGLSDEQRAAFQKVLDENVQLSAKSRETDVDKRLKELEELGLKDRPGALKLYRTVALSDDGGPAVVLLSDDGQEKKRTTAKELLDQFIDAVKGEDGRVHLSDQALASGNDNPPPATASHERDQTPVEDRMKAAREALYGAAAQ